MKEHSNKNTKRLQIHAYSVIILFLLLAGCDSVIDNDNTVELPQQIIQSETSTLNYAKAKVYVCHVNGKGEYRKISIANAALEAHISHGDAVPGNAVPGMEGYIFDDNCEIEQIVIAPDCENPNGGTEVFDNGTGTGQKYCYNLEDDINTRAQKACESHFGEGNCSIIIGGYNSLQWGETGGGGWGSSIHWHPDNHPIGHCAPYYTIGDVVSPGWCGSIIGRFLP